jgi:hypothetical protein
MAFGGGGDLRAKPLGLRSAGIGGAGEGLRVTVGLPAVAGGLARAG